MGFATKAPSLVYVNTTSRKGVYVYVNYHSNVAVSNVTICIYLNTCLDTGTISFNIFQYSLRIRSKKQRKILKNIETDTHPCDLDTNTLRCGQASDNLTTDLLGRQIYCFVYFVRLTTVLFLISCQQYYCSGE